MPNSSEWTEEAQWELAAGELMGFAHVLKKIGEAGKVDAEDLGLHLCRLRAEQIRLAVKLANEAIAARKCT